MSQRILLSCILMLVFVLAGSAAQADYLDFTQPEWSVVNGKHSADIDPTQFSDLTLSFSAFIHHDFGSPENTLLNHDPVAGLGVQGLQQDEELDSFLTRRDLLVIKFSQSVYLTHFTVRKLFNEGWKDRKHETGYYQILDAASNTWSQSLAFSARKNGGGSLGQYDVSVEREIAGIRLAAALFYDPDGQLYPDHDFSLAGLELNASDIEPNAVVPEPASLLLFGSAAGVLGLLKRRRKKQL